MATGSVSSALEDGSTLAIAPSSTLLTANQEPITVIESGPIVPNRGQKRVPVKEENDSTAQSSKKQKAFKKPKVEPETKTKINVEIKDYKKSDIVRVPETEEIIETIEESGIVVESGPVHYADDFNDTDDEEEAFSARKLLTQFRGEEEPSYDDYY
jgi:hypothetical protein